MKKHILAAAFALGLLGASEIFADTTVSSVENPLQMAENKVSEDMKQFGETTKEGVEKGVDVTKKEVKKGAEATKEGVEKGYNFTKKEVKKGAEATKEGVEKGYDATKKNIDKMKNK